MASVNVETASCQGKNTTPNPLSEVDSVDHDSAKGTSLMKNTPAESDACFEPSVNHSSESDLTEAQCNLELRSTKKNTKRKRKRKRNLGDSLMKNTGTERGLCLESEDDVNMKNNLEKLQLSELSSSQKKRRKRNLGKTMVKDTATERGSCLEAEVDDNMNSNLEKTQISELSSSEKKRRKRNSGKTLIKDAAAERGSCLKSEGDVNINTNLEKTQLSELSSTNKNSQRRRRKRNSGKTRIKDTATERGSCLESEGDVNINTNMEKSQLLELSSLQKKRERNLGNSQAKDTATPRGLCLESEGDVNKSTNLEKIQLSELSSLQKKKRKRNKNKREQKHNGIIINDKDHVPPEVAESDLIKMGENSLICKEQSGSPRSVSISLRKIYDNDSKDALVWIEKKDGETYQREETETLKIYQRKIGKLHESMEKSVEPVTMAGQTPLDHSNEVHSFELSENKLERAHVGKCAASVEVVENVLMGKTLPNGSHGEFGCEENKEMTETKGDGDLAVPVVEENVLQVSSVPLEGPNLGCANKKLLILDVNGLLADIVPYVSYGYRADKTISGKSVFRRPFCEDFLQFCFEKFNVGVWSSRTKKNVNMVIDFLMGDSRHNLLFIWDQAHCTDTGLRTIENREKPLLLKELKRLWEYLKSNLMSKGEFNESNTLLLDDSPYKALRNPAHTAIFPYSYHYKDVRDSSLGPGGDLRLYLERLADAENVQEYVAQNPFGQRAITESNPSWGFYRRILAAESCQPQDVASTSVTSQ